MRRASALLTLALLLAAARGQEEEAALQLRQRQAARIMGGDLLIEVLGPDVAALDSALDAALVEIRRVEDLVTDWRPSPVRTLNEAAGQGPQPVPPELARLIARALECARLTGGAFDPTWAGVGRLWDMKRQPPVVPDAAAIKAALERVGWQRVTVDLERSTVDLPAGMRLGLDGISQGYAADMAMAVLMRLGIRHALVNLSGDIKALGRKQGKPWQIAIKHPRERERVLAVIPISNACLTTSGDYERFFEHEGKRYHHIIDPRTGWPSTGAMCATVIAPDATWADALDTALCVLGPEEGLKVVASVPRTEALIVGMDGKVHVSKGLAQGNQGR